MPPSLLQKGYLKFADGRVYPETPITYIIEWIKSNMVEFGGADKPGNLDTRCLVIKSGTGSGKSTTMPVEIFRIFHNKLQSPDVEYTGKSIMCTQPKVLTAKSLAQSIAKESWATDMALGKTIGYNTGSGGKNAPKRGLIYATSGMLAMQLNVLDDEKIMQMYAVIIIDEAHSRTIDDDVLLSMLKDFYRRNDGNKMLPFLLLASATFDPRIYLKYFGLSEDHIIIVEGLPQFAIQTTWQKSVVQNYLDKCVNLIRQICDENPTDDPKEGDILVFIPGIAQARYIVSSLEEYAESKHILVLKLDSSGVNADSEEYRLVEMEYEKLPYFDDGKPVFKRVILSTSVAETGLTLVSLKYCIDCGMDKTSEYYQPDSSGLTTKPASKSNIIQRRGRVGRKFPGKFYPLYTEETFETVPVQELPHMAKGKFSEKYLVVIRQQLYQKERLGMKKEDIIFRVEDLTLLDPPPTQQFIFAHVTANVLGFMKDNVLTPMGQHASKMYRSTKMECLKMIYSAFLYNAAIHDVITLATIFYYNMTIDMLMDYKTKTKHHGILPPESKPLKCSLPSFIATKVYGGKRRNDLQNLMSEDEFYCRSKLLISDNFIELMLVYDAFCYNLSLSIESATTWCKLAGLDLNEMMTFHKNRTDLFNICLDTDMNVTINSNRRLYTQNIDVFVDVLKSLKMCIYEGFKLHVFTFDAKTKKHFNCMGQAIEVEPMLGESILKFKDLTMDIPRVVVANTLTLDQITKDPEDNIFYRLSCSGISVMDGFLY